MNMQIDLVTNISLILLSLPALRIVPVFVIFSISCTVQMFVMKSELQCAAERINLPYILISIYLSTSFWPVDSSNPVVGKPVRKDSRVIKAQNVDVRSMDKVVRQNYNIALSEPRPHDTNLRRIESFELVDKLLRPSSRFHHRVVIHAVVVVHVVHVCCHHGVVLGPRRPT